MRLYDRELSQEKRHTAGTHRACSPLESLQRWGPLAGALGITRLANLTGLDVIGLPVWAAIRPNSRGLASSQGKGFDSVSAKVSALMESIEGWHGEHIRLPLRRDSYEGLRSEGEVAAAIDALPTYAEAVVRGGTPLLWVEGFDLLAGGPVWVPFDCVHTNYVWPGRGGLTTSFVVSSNGLASGNHVLEAISHALAEVVERDAVALTAQALRGGAPELRVDPATVDDPDCARLLDMLEQAGVMPAIFDITSDTGLPAYACTIVDRSEQVRWRTLGAFNGYGCHLRPGIALLRAITEAVQSRLTQISGSRDDIQAADYRRAGNPDDLRRYREIMSASRPVLDFRGRRSLSTSSFEGDIRVMLDALVRVGVESVVVVDLTRAELGVPVVKVVVPGLEAAGAMMGGSAIRPVRRTSRGARAASGS